MLVLDGWDERLRFLGLDGILTATCCPNCVGFLKGPAFNSFTLDGGVEICHTFRAFRHKQDSTLVAEQTTIFSVYIFLRVNI